MRAGSGFDRRYARGIDQPGAAQAFRILPGDEIVGHDGEIDAATLQFRDQRLDQRGLARPDRTANSDPGRRRYGERSRLMSRSARSMSHLSM